jgi:hypothetical protein
MKRRNKKIAKGVTNKKIAKGVTTNRVNILKRVKNIVTKMNKKISTLWGTKYSTMALK